VLKTWLTRELL